jgi:Uma2 family endonuclease
MDTGVLEYWIIDPKEKNARVYVQTGKANIEFSKYEIGDNIPSVVLKDLKINLGRVLK